MKKLCINLLVIFFITGSFVFASNGQRDFEYESKGNRDPFSYLVTKEGRLLPGAKAVSAIEAISLEGIIWDPHGKSLAIINGKPVQEHEEIYGTQVLKIKKTSVIMQKDGEVIVVNLKKGGVNEE